MTGRARENFSKAVHALATAPGNLPERLAEASQHVLAQFVKDDLPESVREEYPNLKANLTKISILELHDEDAKFYAERIILMHEKICHQRGYDYALRDGRKK